MLKLFASREVLMDYRCCVISMFLGSGVQAAVSFADVPTITSRASKFVDNRALISFRGFIFAQYKYVAVNSFPGNNESAF